TALPQGNPSVVVLKVDHPDLDHVLGRGRTVFKIDPGGKHVAAAGVELELVVVAEPVMSGAVGDAAGRREGTGRGSLLAAAARRGDEAGDNQGRSQRKRGFEIAEFGSQAG